MKKRILCFGDSNTWGYIGNSPKRLDEDKRWTGIVSNILGDEYIIIEEGLCGRTTVFDDPIHEGLNGLDYIYPCLMSHNPIDMMIVMLGTNDCKERFGASAYVIAEGMRRLLEKAKSTNVWRKKPKILLISPVPISPEYINTGCAGTMGAGCSEKSVELVHMYCNVATMLKCSFMEAGKYAEIGDVDYMHLTEESHTKLGNAIASQIIEICI